MSPPNEDSKQRSSRRLVACRRIALFALLVVSLVAFWFYVARPRWQAGRYERAGLEELMRACAQGEDVSACLVMANRCLAARTPDKAIAPLSACWERLQSGQLRASVSEQAEIAGYLAESLALSNRVAEASSYTRRGIQLDFNCVPAHVAFALWLNGNGADRMALDELKVVTNLEPNHDLAWFLKAHIHNQSHELDAARAAAQKAIAINPKAPNYWQELGDSYGYGGRHEESLSAYRQELRVAPDSTTAQADVARALAFAARTPEEYREAVERVKSVLDRKIVNRGPGYTLLGELHLRFGDYSAARQALETALKHDDTVPEVYYNIAQARRLTGDAAGAKAAMDKYREMEGHFRQARTLQKQLYENPNNADLHLALAREWEYYHSWSEALREYQVVLQQRPGYPLAAQKVKALAKYEQHNRFPVARNWAMANLLNANATILLSQDHGMQASAAAQPPSK